MIVNALMRPLPAILKAIVSVLPLTAELGGTGLAAYGAALIFLPAGFIVAGAALVLLAQGAER